ncbi:ribonuclease p 21kda subunit [Moniliophthora roreri MCA 2997]|uniref:Ribonuclease p 21kda subunit n=1 Tax=Moniliophthora roreri (strain MCA 2997) TaxID=1381753 RepID=V2WYT9_MONRO|nr:ribonuclease p 21kda subunit [Moniliophthora roreri MCA 2997]KAI3609658.1 ribonuclease p 21kda subunit [Moniliophthora roreri]
MTKKTKNDVPNLSNVANRDIMHRLNFLYQASVYLNSIDDSGSSSQKQPTPDVTQKSNRQKKRKSRRAGPKNLAKSYIDTMKLVSTKTIVRMDPSIKRTLCKGCSTVLMPGSTATVRIKASSSHGHVMTYTCTECRTSRRIPAPPIIPSTSTAEVLDAIGTTAESSSRRKRKLQKPITPQNPPLFARDVGHIVFHGDQQVSPERVSSLGSGSFIS